MLCFIAACIISAAYSDPLPPGQTTGANIGGIVLEGDWHYRFDPENAGIDQHWCEQALEGTVHLPGSTDSNAAGPESHERRVDMLTRVHEFVGVAWYQREVTIPKEWSGKRVTLFLERCHWETQVWLDSTHMGMQDSLCAPHIYDLSKAITPGLHRITIRVDNSLKYKVGKDAHSITGHTQTNWNGIIGAITLKACSPVWIDSLCVTPDAAAKSADVAFAIVNGTETSVSGTYQVKTSASTGDMAGEFADLPPGGRLEQRVTVKLSPAAKLWDEFSPNLQDACVTVSVEKEGKKWIDSTSTVFGIRELGKTGGQISVNGRPVFLRGNLECCIFPRTGYPEMAVDGWLRMFDIARQYGLNHVRFHSWCPPEAAFDAADQRGMMLHVETPVWTELGSDPALDQFVYAEGDRILKEYGNHPSFCMLAVGNEPSGKHKDEFLAKIVEYWQAKDPRRLYTTCAGWPELPGSGYHVVPWRHKRPFRLHGGGPLGPSTAFDYAECLADADAPVIAHELGQWCVYPNYAEIAKYDGTLRAYNLETFRDSLDAHGMAGQDAAFSKASGALQTLMYKADIEAILRTKEAAGFQLLSLQDFPGQGSALVGFLDAFWDSKGYLAPEQFREFCSETVPLLRIGRYTWNTTDTLHAEVEIAHFGKAPLSGVTPNWAITYPDGRVAASGSGSPRDIPIGNGIKLGNIDANLSGVEAPTRLTVTVSLEGLPVRNHWDIWVYPASGAAPVPDSVVVSDNFDDSTEESLRQGKTVLLYPASLGTGFAVKSAFEPIFWNTQWFPGQTRQLGILCEPSHSAFRMFPNDGHTDWQWWDLLDKSTVMDMTSLPQELRPVIQVIDDWNKNRRLGALFEAKVHNGKLIVCSLTGGQDTLAGTWLRNSLVQYAASPACTPDCVLDAGLLKRLFERPSVQVVKADSEAPGYESAKAADGDPTTIWHTPWEGHVPGYPHEIQLKLAEKRTLSGLRILPRQDVANGFVSAYEVYLSDDGKNWGDAIVTGTLEKGSAEKEIRFRTPHTGRYVRFVARSGYDDKKFVAVAEIGVLE